MRANLHINNSANAPARRARTNKTDKLRRFVFGDDVFISYSRRKGAEYALALANELTRQKLSCFLDQWGTPPDEDLPAQLRQALRRSTLLVLIGTEWAAASDNVRKEVEEFLETGRTLIPITFVEDGVYSKIEDGTLEGEFKGTLQQATWYSLIQGVAQTVESTAALKKKQPSDTVVSRIVNAKGFRSRNRRLRSVFWTTLVSILLLLCAGGAAAKVLSDRVAKANQQRMDSEAKATKADKDRVVAEGLTKKANEALKTASQQLTGANKKRDEAQAKATTAVRDQQIAESKTAQAQATQAVAEQMQRRSSSERLATESEKEVEAYPQRGLLLAAEAVNNFVRAGDPLVPLAEQALWRSLSNNGGTLLLGHSMSVQSVAVSPNNRWLATATYKETLLWDLAAGTAPPKPVRLASSSDGDPVTDDISLRFSLDSHWLIEGLRNGKACLWDMSGAAHPAKRYFTLENVGDEIHSTGFTPDGRWVVTIGESSALIWDLKADDPAAKPAVVVSPSGALKALEAEMAAVLKESAAIDESNEKQVAELQRRAREIETKADLESKKLRSVLVTRDFRWLVTSSQVSQVELFDLTAGGPVFKPVTFANPGLRLSKISVSPDKRWLAATAESTDQESTDEKQDEDVAYVWDLNLVGAASKPRVFSGHQGLIRAIEFSPDGRWLVTASHDRTARLWDFHEIDPTAKPIVLGGHPGWVTHVAFSSDGRWLATGGDNLGNYGSLNTGPNLVKVWDLGAMPRPKGVAASSDPAAENLQLGADRRLDDLSFSPDGQWLVAHSSGDVTNPTGGQIVELWHMRAQLTIPGMVDEFVSLRGHEGSVATMAFSPDSRWLVTGGADKSVRLWGLTNREFAAGQKILVSGESSVSSSLISKDNRWLVSTTDNGSALLWDLSAADAATNYFIVGWGTALFTYPLVALSPDSRWLVTASCNLERTKWNLRLYDLKSGEPGARPIFLEGHQSSVTALAFSPDSGKLITGAADKRVLVWDLNAGDPSAAYKLLKVHEGEVSDIAVSSDGRWLATADSSSGKAFLWRLDMIKPQAAPVELRGHAGPVTTVRFSPDSRWLATGSKDKTTRLWNLSARAPDADAIVLEGNEDSVECLTFSPNSRWLATSNYNFRADSLQSRNFGAGQPGTHDGRLWDLKAPGRKPLAWHSQHPSLRAFSFSPDSRWVVTSKNEGGSAESSNVDSRTAMLWDLNSRAGPKLDAMLPIGGWGYNAGFSPDGHWLLVGVRLWNMTADDPATSTFILPAPDLRVGPTAFSSDSRWAIVGASNKVGLYPVRPDELLKIAEHAAARDLTIEEWNRIFPTQKYRRVFEGHR